MSPYLLLADLQITVLAAIQTFSDRVIYPAYATLARAGAISALDDQSMAGVIMWVPGSLVFLVAAVWLVMQALNATHAPRLSEAKRAIGSVRGKSHRAGSPAR